MRRIGFVILLVGLIVLLAQLALYGGASIVAARENGGASGRAKHQQVESASHSIGRTVQFLFVPAAMLLIGSALLERYRRVKTLNP